jgi:D-glycero-D-manno-heptose 1,7-bisphosphate phosphatase
MRPAIFLDRDGVLNHSKVRNGKPYAPTKFIDFKILPGALEALNKLKKSGFALAVVTNQPDVGSGSVEKETVAQMNADLILKLPIDVVKVCYHSQTEGCTCRKPEPGLILEATAEMQLDLSRSYMVGDRWSDISAGKRAGCTTVFIDYNYSEKLVDQPDYKAASLTAAVDLIILQNMDL